jgi:hypothetical protein
MLIVEKPVSNGDIASFKLTSGEEVVARVSNITDTAYVLSKPMVLIASQQGLGLAPFMFSVNPDTKFNMSVHSVACVAVTEKEIASQYLQQTTGLVGV